MSDVIVARRTERREREHASARSAILESARKRAAREGAQGLTLRGVAAEAGYAPAALYGYFRNRSELLLALAADDLAKLTRSVRDAAHGADQEKKFTATTMAALSYLNEAETIAASLSAFPAEGDASYAERLFNGRLIAALGSLADAAGIPAASREGQCDVALLAASIAGLALLARSGRLEALGFGAEELISRLEARFSTR